MYIYIYIKKKWTNILYHLFVKLNANVQQLVSLT